jgi:hypothetical protein
MTSATGDLLGERADPSQLYRQQLVPNLTTRGGGGECILGLLIMERAREIDA